MKLEGDIEMLYQKVREKIWSTELNREERLRYYNTYFYEPDAFYEGKAAGLFDKPNPDNGSIERAAVEEQIPALSRATAYTAFDLRDHSQEGITTLPIENPTKETYTEELYLMTQILDYQKLVDRLIAADDPIDLRAILIDLSAQHSSLSSLVPKNLGILSDDNLRESLQPKERALLEYVQNKSDLSLSELMNLAPVGPSSTGRSISPSDAEPQSQLSQPNTIDSTTLRQDSCPASPEIAASIEEIMKPIVDMLDGCETGLEQLKELIMLYEPMNVSLESMGDGQKKDLLTLATTINQRMRILRTTLLIEFPKEAEQGDSEPAIYTELEKMNPEDTERMRRPLKYIETALSTLREFTANAERHQMPEADRPWGDLMEYFEWRAGWSLHEMLETYCKLWPTQKLTRYVPTSADAIKPVGPVLTS